MCKVSKAKFYFFPSIAHRETLKMLKKYKSKFQQQENLHKEHSFCFLTALCVENGLLKKSCKKMHKNIF